MKYLYFLLTMLVMSSTVVSCSDDDDDDGPDNTASFTVDGNEASVQNVTATEQSQQGITLRIISMPSKSDGTVNISITGGAEAEIRTYDLDGSLDAIVVSPSYTPDGTNSSYTTIGGTVELTKNDESRSEGTFSFTARSDDNTDTVSITSGAFAVDIN